MSSLEAALEQRGRRRRVTASYYSPRHGRRDLHDPPTLRHDGKGIALLLPPYFFFFFFFFFFLYPPPLPLLSLFPHN